VRVLYSQLESPVGILHLASTERGLTAIALGESSYAWLSRFRERVFPGSELEPAGKAHERFERELSEYFAGKRRLFDLPLDIRGTDFQKQVWAAVTQVPFGRTTTYATLALLVDRPKSSRAVGGANGANPLPIVIPCHRVVGASGHLTGYGGGLPIKRWLLTHEGVLRTGAVQMGLFNRTRPSRGAPFLDTGSGQTAKTQGGERS